MKSNESDKIDELSHKIDFLTNLLLKTRQYATTDPETALMQARKSAEAICREIFAAEIGEPGKIMLDELIRKLSQKKLLPHKIRIPLGTIQTYGNYASHAQSDYESIDYEFIVPCLSALVQVTSWYFLEYLQIDVPPQIKEVEQEAAHKAEAEPNAETQQQTSDKEETDEDLDESLMFEEETDKEMFDSLTILDDVKGNETGMSSISGSRLRSEPLTVLEEEAPQTFNIDNVPGQLLEYIQNDFEDQGEVVVDHATGLMWQKSGSDEVLTYKEAQAYIDTLNRDRFADYSDWRLPTVEELMSLLEPEKQSNGLFINPILDATQSWCWTADKRSSGAAWDVSFYYGCVYWSGLYRSYYVRAVRSLED